MYTKWDHKRNEDIFDKLKVKPVIGYIQTYQRKWKEHVNRMNTERILKQIYIISQEDKGKSDVQ
jgi:hypothetical protein